MKRPTFFALALLTVAALALAACGADDADDSATLTPFPTPTATPEQTVSFDATVEVQAGEEPLTVARLDLADRLGLTALDIQLSHVRPTGWDGCLGVTRPEEACTDIFISGLTAWFQAEGADEPYRYHLGASFIIATDFVSADATVTDGFFIDNDFVQSVLNVYGRLAV